MVGETLGNYRIAARIGAGGMGEVYRATHLHIEREVAIKVLLPELAQSKPAVARFLREARATSLIRHPGIVEVFDCAVHGDGRIYIVMELLTGESLGDALASRGSFAGDFPGACALMVQIADALGAAHDKGIVHRDLKPDNVFLQRTRPENGDGPPPGRSEREAGQGPAVPRVKVLDFGIAKLMSPKFPGVNQTRTGEFFGTPLYMAPEQCRGGGPIDHRADIYALGCIAYHMLAGRPPFVHDGTGDLVIAHALEQPADVSSLVPDLPRGLSELVMHMLAKLPDDRPATMAAVVHRLEEILAAPAHPLPPAAASTDRRAGAAATWMGQGPGGSGGAVSAETGTRLLARGEVPLDRSVSGGPARGRGKRRMAVVLAAVGGVAAAIVVSSIVQKNHGEPPSAASGAEAAAPPVWEPAVPAAPPAPPAHAVAPAAAAVDVTTVDVTTVPPGAEVWMAGEAVARGVTPVRVSFGRQGLPRQLVLRAHGYSERSVVVDGDRDSVIAVELQRTGPRPRIRGLARPSAAAERPAVGDGRRRTRSPPGSSAERSQDAARAPSDPTRPPGYRRMAD